MRTLSRFACQLDMGENLFTFNLIPYEASSDSNKFDEQKIQYKGGELNKMKFVYIDQSCINKFIIDKMVDVQEQVQTQIHKYFSENKHIKGNICRLIESVSQRVCDNIYHGKISIGSLTYQYRTMGQQNYRQKLSRLSSLKQSRFMMLSSLREMEEEETRIRSEIRFRHRSKRKLQMSSYTEEDRVKTKESIEQYQRGIKNKLKLFKQRQEKIQHDSPNQKQKVMKKQQRSAPKTKKNKVFSSTNLRYQSYCKQRVHDNQYLYIKSSKWDQKLRIQRQKRFASILEEKRKQMQVNFDQVKKHSLEFDKLKAQKKKASLQYHQQYKFNLSSYIHYPKSRFFKNLQQEEKRKQRTEKQVCKARQEHWQKMQEFNSYVQNNFKPLITQNSKFNHHKQISSKKGHDYHTRLELGNQHMKEGNKMQKKRTLANSQRQDEVGPQYSKIYMKKKKYKNYLCHQKNSKSTKLSFLEKLVENNGFSSERAKLALQYIHQNQSQKSIPKNSKSQYLLAKQKIAFLDALLNSQEHP